MKLAVVFLLSLFLTLGIVGTVSASPFGYDIENGLGGSSTAPITVVINQTTTNVNNSDYLNGHDSSYFYPASNPDGFIDDGNTGWDNLYGFITNAVNNLINYFTKTEVNDMIAGNFTALNNSITNISLTPGPQGIPGVNGTNGYTPVYGVDYRNGTDGTNGIDGVNGTNGINGVNGSDGYTPVYGVDYRNGTDGINGTNGVNGSNGINGTFTDILNSTQFYNQSTTWSLNLTWLTSIFDTIYLKISDMFTKQEITDMISGNYTELNNSITNISLTPGPQGPQGIPGINGTNGINGSQGPQGIPGVNGTDGYTPQYGIDYVNGTNGIDGVNGINGVNGSDGYTPQYGIDYVNGTNGINGVNGTNGQDGINGTFTDILNSTQFYNESNVWSLNLSWFNSVYDLIYLKISDMFTKQEVNDMIAGNYTTLNNSKLNIGDQRYNDSAKADYNFTTNNFNGNGNFNTSGNITTTGYLMGQPLLGMLGSGIIQSTETNPLSEVNVTCSGLNCSYNAFEVRLVSGTSNQFATYCKIPASSMVVTDNNHIVLYVDSNCAIQSTTIETWYGGTIQTGGLWDFANTVCYNGACEVSNGIGLEQRRMMKQRVLDFNEMHLKVVSGLDKQISTFPGFNITSGKYIYLMDVVTTAPVNANQSGTLEYIYHNSSMASGWTTVDTSGIQLTKCDNGTNLVTCTGNNWRRYFIYMVGWNETGKTTSGVHQTAALLGTSYSSLANCLDTNLNPLVYNLPSWYVTSAVPLYAYCARRTDTATQWLSANFIDLRTVKTGSSSTSALETDPVWTAEKVNYYTASQIDANNWNSTYNATYDATTQNVNANQSNWFSKYNASYLTSSYNTTYDATSADVSANRTNWESKYNSSYLTSSYNATYDATTSQWNGNYTASSKYWYNMTPTTFYNSSYLTSSYNATYDAKNTSSIKSINTTQFSTDSNGVLNLIESWIRGVITGYGYLTSSANTTYSATSADVSANRSAWFSTYNASYMTNTYNSTYDATTSQWNGNYTASSKYWYNMTNNIFYNSSYLTSSYNATYDATTKNVDANYTTWESTYNSSYLTSSYNSTYHTTSLDLTANRTAFLSTYNSSYLTSSANTSYLLKAGDSMTGNINMTTKNVTNLGYIKIDSIGNAPCEPTSGNICRNASGMFLYG